MAAVLVALGYCIYTTTMEKRQKKKEQQADLQRNMRSDSEKPTPSALRARDPKGESLRAKAARKLHGKDANPSMLGDPVSVKAESTTHVPTDSEAGSQTTTLRGSESSDRGSDGAGGQRRVNPTMLGDPVSSTAETVERRPEEEQDMEEASRSRRGSKL